MARRTGKNGHVNIDGTTVAHITAWTADIRPVIYRRRPCHSATVATIEVHRYDRSGTFECESNPNDSGQAGLSLTGVTSITALDLYEDNGTILSISNAKVYGGVRVTRNGVVMRQFTWEA